MPPKRRKVTKSPFVGVFDLFRIGIGPSSSHTVGPMRAAGDFLKWAAARVDWTEVDAVSCDLFGSLALTGVGHGTDLAVVAGLTGAAPETVDPDDLPRLLAQARATRRLSVGDGAEIGFDPDVGIVFRKHEFLPGHPNALTFHLWHDDAIVLSRTYYSVGGGFIMAEGETAADLPAGSDVPYPFTSAEELLALCERHGLTIAELAHANEAAFHAPAEIEARLSRIWAAMQQCVRRGLNGRGILPGGLSVKRRAADLEQALHVRDSKDQGDPLRAMEWISLFALAVNEENAAGGRVVTAPTNGAAGIIPAVLRFYCRFHGGGAPGVRTFLLTAGAIGALYKQNASISGAEVGCQGEIGVACSMAAAGLCAVLGGTNAQIENAAEIGMEHNLGLTCDPIGGLVQIPCIERNAMGAIKAVEAARLALLADGEHHVSLDKVIATMKRTGADMNEIYNETSLGGLAVNAAEC